MKNLKPYDGKETIIWKIPNYHNKIWFIEKSDKGKTYTNQTNGCACNHPKMKGILYEFYDYKNDEIPEIFNPKFWYSLYSRGEGYYTDEARIIAEKALGKLPDICSQMSSGQIVSWEEYQAKELEYIEYIKNNNLFIYPSKLKSMFVDEIKKIITPDFDDFDVIFDFLNYDKYGFDIHSSREAWVYVRLYYKDTYKLGNEVHDTMKFVEGVITWQNCD